MKSKQLYPKSVRQLTTNNISHNVNKHRVRCSLCDTLLKASTTHRYLLMGKASYDTIDKNITYGECFKRYLNDTCDGNNLHMICPKCCQNLQKIHKLHNDAEQLTQNIRQTWYKTKRLNRARHFRGNFVKINENEFSSPSPIAANDDNEIVTIKEEINTVQMQSDAIPTMAQSPISVSETVIKTQHDLPTIQRIQNKSFPQILPETSIDDHPKVIHGSKRKKHTQNQQHFQINTEKDSLVLRPYPSIIPVSIRSTGNKRTSSQSTNKIKSSPFSQLMIESPSSSSSPLLYDQQQKEVRRRTSSNSEQTPSFVNPESSLVIDVDRSISPCTNEDETSSTNGAKNTRLSRRQYDFLVELPDQQSLNAFIETSASESGSRWTWRRTSANSRGYKVYYVCNFSMRRHYHPCPAAMYALFHPEGKISIYSCGKHQHIPKDRLPVSITDATKDEIFKCLQSGMATTDIREHLTRLELPFGDTRKLNNFIKYHKELLKFGTVTNIRTGGTAYRQPQCWAIRRQPSSGP